MRLTSDAPPETLSPGAHPGQAVCATRWSSSRIGTATPAHKLRRRVTALQDHLGRHQDAVVAAAQFEELRSSVEPVVPEDARAVLGAPGAAGPATRRRREREGFARRLTAVCGGAAWKRLRRSMNERPPGTAPVRGQAESGVPRAAATSGRKQTVELYLVRHRHRRRTRTRRPGRTTVSGPADPGGRKAFPSGGGGPCAPLVPEVERVFSSPLTPRLADRAHSGKSGAGWADAATAG